MKEKVKYVDLGSISYQDGWDKQTVIHEAIKSNKLFNRRLDGKTEDKLPIEHQLLFCEHLPVFTLGKSGSEDHLLLNKEELEQQGIEYFKINRGGDITYHGPGQIVAYPIFDLDHFFTDVHKYVRFLEEAVIRTLADHGIMGGREEGFTGVWLKETAVLPKRKICAIGVHLSRWVTMHGLALNVNTDLSYFNKIVPCGIADETKAVTSMSVEIGMDLDMEKVKAQLKKHFAELFEFEYK